MGQVRLILVGGFLGAGKTTLLAQAAQRLVRRGQRVGLITNDQAAELVDTQILRGAGFGVSEIAGGCFCCRFGSLVETAHGLIEEFAPDVLIGEPVGSCTDLSATVLQPLKERHAAEFRLAPLSVVVDPARLYESLRADGPLPDSVVYVFRKQLEEADLILLNKCDLLAAAERDLLRAAAARQYPDRPILPLSALTGDGVDEWLDLLATGRPAGRTIAEVDYDTYAEGEALLGWLNASVALGAATGADWAAFVRRFIEALQGDLRARPAEIAHLKLYLKTDRGALVANLTSTAGEPSLRGRLEGEPPDAALTINARVNLGPDELRRLVDESLQAAAGDAIRVEVNSVRSFRPARPEPVHRFDRVV